MTERRRIGKILKSLGLYPNILGYAYLIDIVELTLAEEAEGRSSRVTLKYEKVAKKNGTTASRVERAIRHAAEMAYESTPHSVWVDFVGNQFTKQLKNSQFIAQVADKYSEICEDEE